MVAHEALRDGLLQLALTSVPLTNQAKRKGCFPSEYHIIILCGTEQRPWP